MSRKSDDFSTSLALANSIAHILLQLNPVEIVTPTNLQQEKQTWIAAAQGGGFFGTPRFTYNYSLLHEVVHFKDSLTNARKYFATHINKLSQDDKIIGAILLNRIDDAIRTIKMAQTIIDGNDKATACLSLQKYGRPDEHVLRSAQIAAKSREHLFGEFPSRFTEAEMVTLKAMSFNAEQIKYWFKRAIDLYGIRNWTIVISDEVSAIDVRDKTASGNPTVYIPTNRRVDGLKLLELIGHEINCHLRDSANTNALLRGLVKNNPCLLPLVPAMAKSDDEFLYEAHAKLSDVSVNGTSAIPKPYYIVAQELARQGKSFSEVAYTIFELQESTTTKSTKALATSAWTTAYRVFRGCTNLQNPDGYVFWKDHAYLSGYLAARKNPDSALLDYATLSNDELKMLEQAGIDLMHPAYPHQDIVGIIKAELLA